MLPRSFELEDVFMAIASSPGQTTATSPPADCAEVRLQFLESQVKDLKSAHADKDESKGKDWLDKFEKLSSILWPVVTLLISLFVTQRIENALKERELHLENIKDMQQLMQEI